MRRANEDEFLVACHLGASLARADAKELDDQEVELKDELSDVLVLPHALVHFRWQLADFHHI